MKYLIYLFIAIILICFFYCYQNKLEMFENEIINSQPSERSGIINARPVLTVAKNVRLNKFNRIDDITIKAPLPREGESKCQVVKCPSFLASDAICWRCH